jgi:hypothetical protein
LRWGVNAKRKSCAWSPGIVEQKKLLTDFRSAKAAQTHKAKGMRKLEMKSRIDVVRYALLQGWPQDT